MSEVYVGTRGALFSCRRCAQSFLKAMPPQLVGGFTRQLMPGLTCGPFRRLLQAKGLPGSCQPTSQSRWLSPSAAGSMVMASGEVQLCFWPRDGLGAMMPATAGVHGIGGWSPLYLPSSRSLLLAVVPLFVQPVEPIGAMGTAGQACEMGDGRMVL